MNDRQRAALLEPASGGADTVEILGRRRRIRQRGDGTFLVVILAVDR